MKINKNYNVKWEDMPNQDKVLLTIEFLCYFVIIITFVLIVIAINKDFYRSAFVLFLSILGLYACGRSAKSSREYYLNKLNLHFKINKKLESSKIITIS